MSTPWLDTGALNAFAHEKLKSLDLDFRTRRNIVRLYICLCLRYFKHGLSGNKIETSKTRHAILKDASAPVTIGLRYKGNLRKEDFYSRLDAMAEAGFVNRCEHSEPVSLVLPPSALTSKTASQIQEIRRDAGRKLVKRLDDKLAKNACNGSKSKTATAPSPPTPVDQQLNATLNAILTDLGVNK